MHDAHQSWMENRAVCNNVKQFTVGRDYRNVMSGNIHQNPS